MVNLISKIQKTFGIDSDFYLVSESEDRLDLKKISEKDIKGSEYRLEIKKNEMNR